MLELPTELDKPDFSPPASAPHNEQDTLLGDSETAELLGGLLKSPLRDMNIDREPTMGDDSGEDSARVEWCRLVAAREKSKPLDRRGNDAGGEHVADDSGFGDTGSLFERFAVLVLEISRWGICKLRPRGAMEDLLGVTGLDETLKSSLEERTVSTIDGEGESVDLNP